MTELRWMATATSDNDTRLPGLPRYIRINTLKTSRSEAAKSLTATGHVPEQPSTYRAARKGDAPAESSGRSYVPDAHVPDLLVFKPKGQSDISRIPLVASGALVVQQKASCFPAVALAPPPGAHVIDGCAAPGNKTCHIAALMGGRGSVVAFEQDARRHQLLKEQMALKGATTVTTVHGSFLDADPKDYAYVTHILLDPSCSSSGMSTSPVRDPAGIAALAAAQKTLLLHAMTFPSVRAIVYSTCSVYDEENEMVVRDVLRAQSRFILAPALPWWHRRGHRLDGGDDAAACLEAKTIARRVVRTLYPDDATIGFFLCRFVTKEHGVAGDGPYGCDENPELYEKMVALARRRERDEKLREKRPEAAAPAAAAAAREVPQWRLERDQKKTKKKREVDGVVW